MKIHVLFVWSSGKCAPSGPGGASTEPARGGVNKSLPLSQHSSQSAKWEGGFDLLDSILRLVRNSRYGSTHFAQLTREIHIPHFKYICIF